MALRTTTTRAERRRRGQHFEKKGERRVSSSSFNPRPLFFSVNSFLSLREMRREEKEEEGAMKEC